MSALVMLNAAGRATAVTVNFQENVSGYVGTADTYMRESGPGIDNGASTQVGWDGEDVGLERVGLIRFDNIFGGGAGQIPIGSAILSASLTYTVFDVGDNASLYESTVDWVESTTWSTFGGTPGVQPSEYGELVDVAEADTTGAHSVNVTSSLSKWSVDPAHNKGWLFMPAQAGGVFFRSSEYGTASARPRLSVVYDVAGPGPTLVRRPYLQRVTSNSATVVWRTNIATSTRLRYGSSPAMLTSTLSDATLVANHIVTINGLSPATRIYYDVGTTTTVLAGGDANHFVDTAPAPGASVPFTAWLLGDSGTGDANQAAVRDAMLAHVGLNLPDLFIHVGDMAYEAGTETEFTTRFFTPYQDILRNTVCWPTLGNHEAGSATSSTQVGPYFAGYVLPAAGEAGGVASGTEAYYSFDYANVHFVCLDSHDSDRSPGSAMLTWLAADLAATDQDWLIAFWHHPPYSKGSHDSDDPLDSGGRSVDMREDVLPILESGGVDLVLAGHSHIYERSFLVDGAYDTPTTAFGHIVDFGDGQPGGDGPYLKPLGLSGHQGAVYVVCGHGGRGLGGVGGHPLMYFTELEFGSCLLSMNGATLRVDNIRHDGVVSDTFTIIKSAVLVGDIDGDGDADSADITALVQVLLGLDTDPARVMRSDVNLNGTANGDDIRPYVEAFIGP